MTKSSNTRDEEIKDAAISYQSLEEYPNTLWIRQGFRAGAKWSDEHLSPEITKAAITVSDAFIETGNKMKETIDQLKAERDCYREALEKIADPRKRDHKEPDAYTTLGCVMHIADQALEKWNAQEGEK